MSKTLPENPGFAFHIPPTLRASELIAILNLKDRDENKKSEIAAWKDHGMVHIYIYLDPEEEDWFQGICDIINTHEYAPVIGSIEIKGPDAGINDVRIYDLTQLLIKEDVKFSNLHTFEVEQNSGHYRNVITITYGGFFDDNGAAGMLLDKMPALKILTLPSAPTANFVDRENHPLEELSVQGGLDHQGFICKLASSSCFPKLKVFEWTDGPREFGFPARVPIAHFKRLLKSSHLNLDVVHLNDTLLPPDEGKEWFGVEDETELRLVVE